MLPKTTVNRILYYSNKDILNKLPLFSHIEDESLIQYLAVCLKPSVYLPYDYIIYKNDIGKEMFFVIKGVA